MAEPTFEGTVERLQQMLDAYDKRTGPFSSLHYAYPWELFDSMPSAAARAYVYSPDVRRILEEERLQYSAFQHSMHRLSDLGIRVAERVDELLRQDGYVRPPVSWDGKRRWPSKQLLRNAADRVRHLGGQKVELRSSPNYKTIAFVSEGKYLDPLRLVIDFHVMGDSRLQISGGVWPVNGFLLDIANAFVDGHTLCGFCKFTPDRHLLDYLHHDNSEAKINNMIDLLFAQASYF